LNSITATPLDSQRGQAEDRISTQPLSQHSQEVASERLTSSLLSRLTDIAQNDGAADESHRDGELVQAVSRAVLDGLATGYTMAHEDDVTLDQNLQNGDPGDTKRRRLNGHDDHNPL